MTIEPKPALVFAAENAISKAVQHYILLEYNFPSEAIDCISQLFNAMELLLRQHFESDELYLQNSKELIDTYWIENSQKRDTANWLRETRNSITHEGEALWEDKYFVIRELKNNFVLIKDLYEGLEYSTDEVFSDLEQSVLQGKEPKWYDLAKALIVSGNRYVEIDQEATLQIYYSALDIAIRGFAESWRVENTETLSLLEIINLLKDYEYEFECKYHSGDWLPEWYPYYISSYDRMNLEKNLEDIIEIDDNELRNFTRDWGSIHGLQLYLQVIEAAVMQLVYRYPSLDFYECLCNSWDDIMDEMIMHNPDIKKLELTNDAGIDVMWDAGRYVGIYIIGKYSDYKWDEEHKDQLREIIDRTCGPIPKDLKLNLEPSKFGRRIE
jgi:hypothetical protein